MIYSLLQTDLYKLTMQQLFFHRFNNVNTKYRFKCRNKNINLLFLKPYIEKEVLNICNLSYSNNELDYLKNIKINNQKIFQNDFIEYLRTFKLNKDFIHIDENNGNLDIWAEGPITAVSPFEIYILMIVSELYYHISRSKYRDIIQEGKIRLEKKIQKIYDYDDPSFRIIDYGARRAFSTEWHNYVVEQLQKKCCIIGTSNIKLAYDYQLPVYGTMAHEYIQLFQGLNYSVYDSQKTAFQIWLEEYQGELSIALSDTLGDNKFLYDFDKNLANSYSGIRHDSGDPIAWGEKMIDMYKKYGIDPQTKTFVFSDGLTIDKALELHDYFYLKSPKISFGIGTHLTNDLGVEPLQNVMKLVEVNNRPVAKISNNPEKIMCENSSFLKYLKEICNI
jgi:nicotinate phosphoribosyltransferase